MSYLTMLEELCEMHGPTHTARMIGVSYQAVLYWRKGERSPMGPSLTAIRLLHAQEFGRSSAPGSVSGV